MEADVILVVFAVNNKISLSTAQKILEHLTNLSTNKNKQFKIVLVANKIDLLDQYENKEEALKLSDNYKIPYFELTNENYNNLQQKELFMKSINFFRRNVFAIPKKSCYSVVLVSKFVNFLLCLKTLKNLRNKEKKKKKTKHLNNINAHNLPLPILKIIFEFCIYY
jgi:GTPase SAR1 family protein